MFLESRLQCMKNIHYSRKFSNPIMAYKKCIETVKDFEVRLDGFPRIFSIAYCERFQITRNSVRKGRLFAFQRTVEKSFAGNLNYMI